MRKTVKLAAASAIAAMALAGTATAASAAGHDKKDDGHGWNVCGNNDGSVLSAKDNGDIDVDDDVEVEDNNNQVNCQNGVNNKSEIEYEYYGDGLFAALSETLASVSVS